MFHMGDDPQATPMGMIRYVSFDPTTCGIQSGTRGFSIVISVGIFSA